MHGSRPSSRSGRGPRVRYSIPVALRLLALHRELNEQMDIRITEPVFFLGSDRKVGDILRNVQIGPYRGEVVPGGLKRVAQFVEMPEEIKQTITAADVSNVPPQVIAAANLQQPMPQVPAQTGAAAPAPKPAVKGNPLAARVRELTARNAKFEDMAAQMLGDGETQMAQIEANGPGVLKRFNESVSDKLAAITDLGSSLKAMDEATNGNPS